VSQKRLNKKRGGRRLTEATLILFKAGLLNQHGVGMFNPIPIGGWREDKANAASAQLAINASNLPCSRTLSLASLQDAQLGSLGRLPIGNQGRSKILKKSDAQVSCRPLHGFVVTVRLA
jgi:hypothetical protein